jgi:TetR/AcrR family transcriptional regulator, cholesterol catabolism regulator
VATREAIIEAAARVFRTKGYHAASVQDIADAVGILKGSLYHHFESKEELLYLIVKEPRARLYKTVADIVADDAPAGQKLRRAILAHLEAFDQHYPHLFVYLREREEMKRRFRGAPKEYERYWQQILREGVKSGEFRVDLDVQVVSYGLLGMVNWLYKWYDPRGRLSVREIAAQLSTTALAGLVAAERSGERVFKGPVRTRKAT